MGAVMASLAEGRRGRGRGSRGCGSRVWGACLGEPLQKPWQGRGRDHGRGRDRGRGGKGRDGHSDRGAEPTGPRIVERSFSCVHSSCLGSA
jgi:hypothetical protein